MNITYEEIKNQAMTACRELIEAAKLNAGDILVVGASSSEVMGMNIGKGSDNFTRTSVSPAIDDLLVHPLLHMQLLREKFCFPSEPEFAHLMVKRQVPAPYQ